ncbi:Argininosuccinate lyase [Bienertia sinuspersici]
MPIMDARNVYEQLLKRCEEDEAFKKRSEQAKKNKRGGSLSNKVEPGHCQGSVSTNEYAKRMAKENGGILPKAADVYLRTHSKEEPGKGKQLVGSKAKQVMGEYDKKMAEYKDKGIDKDPNEVYFEAVGGRKKGLIPSLGSAGDLYYEKPSSRTDKAKWERQRAEWERERLQVEKERYQKEQAQQEEVRKISEYLVEMQKTMQGYSQMFSQCGGSFPFTHPRDPPDSTRGGAPCAS